MNVKTIAKLANCSVATVSRVINGNPNVKEDTKIKIEKIIEENNYVPSNVGITMLKKKSNVVGIVLPIVHSYYTERFNAIYNILSENGYTTLISVSNYDIERDIETLKDFLKRQVDGVIFMTTKRDKGYEEVLKKYKNKRPLIFVDSDGSDFGFSSVYFDDYTGAKEAVSYLINMGHQKIGFIEGGGTNPISKSSRYNGYIDTLKENNIFIREEYIVNGDYSLKSGYDSVEKLLEYNELTAIYCANDNMAIGAARKIYEMGLRIPEDISLIGTDNIEPVKYMCPATLTTIKQDQYKSGEIIANMILKYMKEGSSNTEKIILKQELVIRDSVKNIK